MSCLVNRIFNFAFLTAIIAGTATIASAQQANFHLPFEAKWGALTLPPGDYHVQLPQPSIGSTEILVRGPASGFVMTMASDAYGVRKAPSNNDYLQLVKVNDVYYVTKFEDATRATTFWFKAPKESHTEQAAAREVLTIPVAGN
jgi:hypothetical protein